MGSKLFVGGLSWNTTDASLRTAFETFGQIREARVILDRETGKSRGFGFVTFQTNDDAAAAIRSMNGAMVDGRTIRVNEAEERRPGGPGGPGGGGHGGGGGPGGPGGDRRGPPRRDGDGPRPEVHTRGRPPFRGGEGGGGGGGGGGPRPGGGWSPSGPSFRPPPPPQPGEGDWGEDRTKRQERRPKKKPALPGTAAYDEEMRMRAVPKREKRESGRSWRDYTVDEDDENAPDVEEGEGEASPAEGAVEGEDGAVTAATEDGAGEGEGEGEGEE